MAILNVVEVVADRSVSGKFREPYTYSRSFLVRVDDPQESVLDIALAPGIRYLDAHPDDASCACQDFSCQAADDTGLYYRVGFKYTAVAPEDQGKPLEVPPDQWGASGSITTGPCTEDKDGKPIVNAAGDPIPELEMDHAELRLSLTRCYTDLSWTATAAECTNAVNSSAWNAGPARTWKCHFQNAAKRVESGDSGSSLVYWETTWDFVYREATWDVKPLNVGLQEKDGGKKKVIKVDGEPAVQAVALDDAGKATPTADPTVINGGKGSRVYREADFSVFGVPQ
jgi:hypothetical protein